MDEEVEKQCCRDDIELNNCNSNNIFQIPIPAG